MLATIFIGDGFNSWVGMARQSGSEYLILADGRELNKTEFWNLNRINLLMKQLVQIAIVFLWTKMQT